MASRGPIAWFAWLVVLLAAPALSEAPRFALVPLGDLGGGESRAAGLNENDWVVGESETSAGHVEAFLWRPEQGMISLGTLGGPVSRALDINRHGVVVGESTDSHGITRAFQWTESDGMTALPTPEGAWHSAALAVNDLGQIVGTLDHGEGVHAVRWEEGRMRRLHRLPGAGPVQPLDVNERGDVVGHIVIGVDDTSASHAFYFREGLKARHLAEFRMVSALSGSAAVAVNEPGWAAGYVMLDSSRVRAFRYRPDQGLEVLEDGDALYATATDLNDDGWVTGSYIASYAADESACFWINGEWHDANHVTDFSGDWWLIQIAGINNRRHMAGYGTLYERNQAFLLRPAESSVASAPARLALRVSEEIDRADDVRVVVLVAEADTGITLHRVTFFAGDDVLGSVDRAPFEWGWEGPVGDVVTFYAEGVTRDGQRLRSPRVTTH